MSHDFQGETQNGLTTGPSPGLSCIMLAGGEANIMNPKKVVHSDPEILGGTSVFVGTRVPAQSLFDYLGGGETLDEFLQQFPSVKRKQALLALEIARESLISSARST